MLLRLLFALVAACAPAFAQQPAPPAQSEKQPAAQPAARPRLAPLPRGVVAHRDLEYAHPDSGPLLLDLYLPEKHEGKLPLIIWIHGGGWQAGSKNASPAPLFATRGYAAASISYRLSQVAIFPAQIHDCKAAVRWLRANAAQYDIDPDHVGVWGASAGGHLVALLGTTAGDKELEGELGNADQSTRVQAVVDWFGPADLTEYNAAGRDNAGNAVAHLLGGSGEKTAALAKQASPVTYVTADDAPFLIMHGDKDNLVPIDQSRKLDAALKAEGVEVMLRVIEGAGHGFQMRDAAGFGEGSVFKPVLDFFDQHLKPGPGAKPAAPAPTK